MAAALARPVQLGSKGRDVFALARALRKAKFLEADGPPGTEFDPPMEEAVREFQRKHGIQATGKIGKATFAKLAPFVDAFGESLLAKVAEEQQRATTTRQRIVDAAHCGFVNRDQMDYTQTSRRMDGVKRKLKPPTCPTAEDCSSFATWCYFAAGAEDPNGRDYDGLGFTGTLVTRGRTTSTPQPGDLVFYGGTASVPAHVAVYVGNGKVVSHGQPSGPSLLAHDYRPIQQIRTYLD